MGEDKDERRNGGARRQNGFELLVAKSQSRRGQQPLCSSSLSFPSNQRSSDLLRHRDLLQGGGGATQASEAGEEEWRSGGYGLALRKVAGRRRR
ncbi:hypothetical protein TB2_033688 [Malus domestica]